MGNYTVYCMLESIQFSQNSIHSIKIVLIPTFKYNLTHI